MFARVLIANRGAIACRIIRTLRRLGIRSIAVYSEPDRHSLHVEQADEAICIGPAAASESYLSIANVLSAACASKAEAIHPGYGFLSENPVFATGCEQAGIAFIGPTAEQMNAFGLKHAARQMAASLGVPLLPGTSLLKTADEALASAVKIGFPVMAKSTAGGGGIGIRLCRDTGELEAAFEAVGRLSASNFGDSGVFIERYVEQARHIEVQIFGDGCGSVVALGERDCSAQRRNQKVIEETPAPGLREPVRLELFRCAVKLGEAVKYRSAGTVEFIYDNRTEEFFFLEVNTRLQVEHGITEEVNGIDLVEWMIRLAAGELPALSTLSAKANGHSIEARIYAEDAGRNFQPSSGRLIQAVFPTNARVETWVEAGSEVTPFYDPMIAKLIVHGPDRDGAVQGLKLALEETAIAGIETNLDYLKQICASPEFESGAITTSYLSRFRYRRAAVEVIESGTQTTLQDFPGRTGYWNVGVPPSGPMDALAFQLANRLVGNEESCAALEITMLGPALRFGCDAIVAITGAEMGAALDGVPVERWRAFTVPAGATLQFKSAKSAGLRAYLAVRGGFNAPKYLGSRSTFLLGRFGGHAGRMLRPGDVMYIGSEARGQPNLDGLGEPLIPIYAHRWDIGVLYGPHGAPDFFTPEDIEMFFSTDWKVHHQSDRTGVRLIGPKPKWARLDGGEAGLHPSNIHDNAYAVGAIDFTGDMPILLGPDGPSLGGFVCPAVIANAELWKMGQLRPGDSVRFQPLTYEQAIAMDRQMEESIATLSAPLPGLPPAGSALEPAILKTKPAMGASPQVCYRADGDRYLLIEFGPNILDLELRLRVHLLEQYLRETDLRGVMDITPGIRSLHIHYDTRLLSRAALLDALEAAQRGIPPDLNVTIPAGIVRMPLSWDDPQTRLAAEKYMQSVRPDAPWCPSNIEFIRRINGFDSVDDVRRIVFDCKLPGAWAG